MTYVVDYQNSITNFNSNLNQKFKIVKFTSNAYNL